jgi:hypothetical protein
VFTKVFDEPEWGRIVGSSSEANRQLGNAMPNRFVAAIVGSSVDTDGTVSVVENSWLQAVQRFKPAAVLKRRFQR